MSLGGGLRLRMIQDSFQNMLTDALDDLGWFSTNRNHAPVTFVTKPVDPLVEIKPILVAASPEDTYGFEWEMGSNLEEVRWEFYIDIFADSHSVGLQLMGDINDTLKGKLPSIGRTGPVFQVYDYRQTTPTEEFVCQLENIEWAKPRLYTKKWLENWWTGKVEVVDYYYDADT